MRAIAGPVIAVVLVAAWWLTTVLSGPAYQRLAVLPPDNVMNDPEQEHIIQGMLNGLISELGQAGITIVGSVQSMMRYRDTEMTVREIAAELGVDAVIESSFLWVGDSVAIDARLTDGRTEESLWSQSYDEDARNVLALYRQVTGAVAAEIHSALTPQAEARLAGAQPVDPQAYEAWLRGGVYLGRVNAPDLETALEYYELALEIDPDYAPAYGGIAMVWVSRLNFGYAPHSEAAPRARAALARSLELDSTAADQYGLLATIRTWVDWDWEGAGAAFRRAIELDPSREGDRVYALFLIMMLRPDEALRAIERAVELDPFNLTAQRLRGFVLYLARRYDDAIAQLQNLLSRQPDNPAGFSLLGSVYYAKGMYDEWLAATQSYYSMTGIPQAEEALALGYAEGGYRAAGRHLGDTLATLRSVRHIAAADIAWCFLVAGENSLALDWLEQGFEEHGAGMMYLSADPVYDGLRDEPRFQDLLRQMGLPQ